MVYLQPVEYTGFGLAPDTTDDWIVTASAMIDAHCRRSSLGSAQYTERLRVVGGSPSVRLSYLPLAAVAPVTTPLVSVEGRYARPRRGELGISDGSFGGLVEAAYAFSLPGTWVAVDVATVDVVPDTGELTLPWNLFGIPFTELNVTYTAGLTDIPVAVKVACAQVVKNAQATPGMNVKSSRLDMMQVQYFSDSLMDKQVQALLRPYVANRLG